MRTRLTATAAVALATMYLPAAAADDDTTITDGIVGGLEPTGELESTVPEEEADDPVGQLGDPTYTTWGSDVNIRGDPRQTPRS